MPTTVSSAVEAERGPGRLGGQLRASPPRPRRTVTMASGPPAIRPTTSAGSVLKVGGHSLASSTPEPAGRARARVDQPAAAGHPLGDGVDGGGDPGQPRGDGGGHGGVLAVHDAGDVEGGQPVDVGELGPEGLGGQGLQLGAERC